MTPHPAEDELWTRVAAGDTEAETLLLIHYAVLVHHAAARLKRRLPSHIRVDDLRAAGREGLWQAIRAFSPHLGHPFAHYAQARIRGAMLDELRRTDDLTRTERSRLQQAHAAYEAQQAAFDHVVSLDDGTRYDWIVDDAAISPEEAALRGSDIDDLNRALVKLTDQEQLVLSMVFMEGLTLAETSEVLSLSRSRISAVYNGAIRSLRGSLLQTQRAKR